MVREETKKIIAGMMASFPNYKPQDLGFTVDIWTEMLGEYEYQDVSKALKSYIATNTSGFAPSIGQIIDLMHKVHEIPNEMSELEAWNKVYKAICNSSYHAKEEFDNLPPLIQKIVVSPNQLAEWGRCDIEEVNTVIQSNFMRSYKAKSSQQKTFNRLPSDVKQQIALEMNSVIGIGVNNE